MNSTSLGLAPSTKYRIFVSIVVAICGSILFFVVPGCGDSKSSTPSFQQPPSATAKAANAAEAKADPSASPSADGEKVKPPVKPAQAFGSSAPPAVPPSAAASGDPPPKPPSASGPLTIEDLSSDGSPCKVNGRVKLQVHFMGTPLGSDRLLIGRLCIDEGESWKAYDRDKYWPLNGPSTVIAKGDKNFGYVDSSKNVAPDGNPVDRHDRLVDVYSKTTIKVIAWENGHDVTYTLNNPEIIYIEDSSDQHVRGICAKYNGTKSGNSWFDEIRKQCSWGNQGAAKALDQKYWATRDDLASEVAARLALQKELDELKKKGMAVEPPKVQSDVNAH